MRTSRMIERWMVFCGAVCLATSGRAQSKQMLEQFEKGPYLGTVDQALVGVEVTNVGGGTKLIRRGNGLLLRCDGFVLAPVSLFSLSMGKQEADSQTVAVVLHPGEENAKRLPAHRPRLMKNAYGYVVFKVDDLFAPALRTLRPESLKPNDAAEVVCSAWDEQAGKFAPIEHRQVTLAEAPKDEKTGKSNGITQFAEPLEAVPTGAVVIGPEGLAIGIVPGATSAQPKQDRFLSFSLLSLVTNCVTPLPVPDKSFSDRARKIDDTPSPANPPAETASPAPANDKPATALPSAPGMVAIPGGPILMPISILNAQPDMAGAQTACVAPFLIDKYEVTNGQYLTFWRSLPEKDRQSQGVRSGLYPLGWMEDDEAPFPSELENAPVLGVRLAGAQAYAAWKGKRLPTPYEWCRAAFGPGGVTQVPAWVIQYVADRQKTWLRVHALHKEYIRQHPELGSVMIAGGGVAWNSPEMFPGVLPWYFHKQQNLRAAEWSKRVVEVETEHLWRDWKDPLYVLPVGSRPFDVSPYGAMDMILNADEMVVPWPGSSFNTSDYYIQISWLDEKPKREPDPQKDLFHVWWSGMMDDFPENLDYPYTPALLSRRFQSGGDTMPAETYLAPVDYRAPLQICSNLYETAAMLHFVGDWNVGLIPGPITPFFFPYFLLYQDKLHVSDKHNSTDLLTSDIFAASAPLWNQPSPHFHQETGRPIPADPMFHIRPDAYLIPGGFRCAR